MYFTLATPMLVFDYVVLSRNDFSLPLLPLPSLNVVRVMLVSVQRRLRSVTIMALVAVVVCQES